MGKNYLNYVYIEVIVSLVREMCGFFSEHTWF